MKKNYGDALLNFDKAIEQRDQTLARMVDVGSITQVRADEIKAMKIILNENDRQKNK